MLGRLRLLSFTQDLHSPSASRAWEQEDKFDLGLNEYTRPKTSLFLALERNFFLSQLVLLVLFPQLGCKAQPLFTHDWK